MPLRGIGAVDTEFEPVEQIHRPGRDHGDRADADPGQVVTGRGVPLGPRQYGHDLSGDVRLDGDAHVDVGGVEAHVVQSNPVGVDEHGKGRLEVRLLGAEVDGHLRLELDQLVLGTGDHHRRGRRLRLAALVARRRRAGDPNIHRDRYRRERVQVDLHRRRRADQFDVRVAVRDRDWDRVRAGVLRRRPVDRDREHCGVERIQGVLIPTDADQHGVHRVHELKGGRDVRRTLRHGQRDDLGLRRVARVDHADPGEERDDAAPHLELPVPPDEPRDAHGCERRPRVRSVPTLASGRSLPVRPGPPSLASSVTSISWSLAWSRPR